MISRNLKAPATRPFLWSAAAAITFFALIHSAAQAQLEWETTTIEQTLDLGQEKSEAVFSFENTGTYPVRIQSTKASCGCTTANLDRTLYEPGEKGEITAKFDVGNRTGTRRNTVRVQTDDPANRTTTLTYAITIPSLVTISPRLIHWRMGEEPEKKTVSVKVNPAADVEIKGVEVDNKDFKVLLNEGETPGEYEVELTPLKINSRGRAIISLQTDPEMENQRNFSFYAYVR